MTEKKLISARLSEATRAKLINLMDIYGTQTEVLAVAIDQLWQKHFGKKDGKND